MNQSSANGGTKARLHEGPRGPHKLPPRRLSELVFCHRPLTHFAPIMGSWQVVLPVDSLQAPWEGELPTPALSRASHGSMTWGGGGVPGPSRLPQGTWLWRVVLSSKLPAGDSSSSAPSCSPPPLPFHKLNPRVLPNTDPGHPSPAHEGRDSTYFVHYYSHGPCRVVEPRHPVRLVLVVL